MEAVLFSDERTDLVSTNRLGTPETGQSASHLLSWLQWWLWLAASWWAGCNDGCDWLPANELAAMMAVIGCQLMIWLQWWLWLAASWWAGCNDGCDWLPADELAAMMAVIGCQLMSWLQWWLWLAASWWAAGDLWRPKRCAELNDLHDVSKLSNLLDSDWF